MDASGRQERLDARVRAYYGAEFDEDARLGDRSVEFLRTLEITREHLDGGRVVDIGGGTGRYARALLADGYLVELVDPVPRHVEHAAAAGVSARVGDARDLPFSNGAFDAALLLGPLYHLAARADRLRALREAARVTRPGGVVVAAAISRLVAFGRVHRTTDPSSALPLEDCALLTDGTPPPDLPFPAGHFHSSGELRAELEEAGLDVRDVVGVQGPAGLLLQSIPDPSADLVEAALLIARRAQSMPAMHDASPHLLGVGVVR